MKWRLEDGRVWFWRRGKGGRRRYGKIGKGERGLVEVRCPAAEGAIRGGGLEGAEAGMVFAVQGQVRGAFHDGVELVRVVDVASLTINRTGSDSFAVGVQGLHGRIRQWIVR